MGGVALRFPFRGQEVVIAATFVPRIRAADFRPRLIDGAAALVGVEKAANAAEMLIGLAAHGIGLVPVHFGKFDAGGLKAQPEMLGKALHIAAVQGDYGIGTAISGAF